MVRDIADSLFGDWDYRPSPAFESVNQFGRFVRRIRSTKKRLDEDKEINWKGLTSDGIMTAGYTFGLPASQFKIMSEAMFDLLDDDYDVGPMDFLRYRKREKAK
jgi:hypothetical protein